MLFNVNKKKSIVDFLPAGAIKFNPLSMPSYLAGYYMNYDNDVPIGSIDHAASSGQWWDRKVLSSLSKVFNRGNIHVVGAVNGYRCQNINIATARLQNTTKDVLTGITNFSYLIGFKRAAVGLGHMLIAMRNTADSVESWLILRNSSKLELTLTQGANQAILTTANNYDDDTWHAAVCSIDQTNKTVSILTDLGESLSNTNAALGVPIAFTGNNNSYNQMGAWWIAGLTFSPGYFGDIIYFDKALSTAEKTALLTWEKTRLGI